MAKVDIILHFFFIINTKECHQLAFLVKLFLFLLGPVWVELLLYNPQKMLVTSNPIFSNFWAPKRTKVRCNISETMSSLFALCHLSLLFVVFVICACGKVATCPHPFAIQEGLRKNWTQLTNSWGPYSSSDTHNICYMSSSFICVQDSPGPAHRAWDRSQGASGRSQRNGYSGPGPRVFDIAPFQSRGVSQWLFYAIYNIIKP